jgi:hypothetical protein
MIALGGLFVVAASVYSFRLAAPFTHYDENVTACYANWGRTYLRLGYRASGWAVVKTVDPLRAIGRVRSDEIYAHRPPTVALLVSVAVRLFGSSEATLRGVGVLATLATLAVFASLATRLLGSAWGLAAAAIFALTPAVSFYGVAIAHQSFGLCGALLILRVYLWWRDGPSSGRLWALAGITVVACWLDWPAFYGAAAGAGLHAVLRPERRRVALVTPAAALLAFGLFLLYVYFLDPVGLVPLRDFLATGVTHSSRVPLGAYVSAYLGQAFRWITVPLLILAAAGVLRLRPRADLADAAIVSTVFLGADAVLFPTLFYGHPFLIVPLAPFAALGGTWGMRWLCARRWTRALAVALVVGFVIQASAVLIHARRGGDWPSYAGVSRRLGAALRRHTRPEERTLVRASVDPHLLAYYAERRVGIFDGDGIHRLEGADADLDEDALIGRLGNPGGEFAWFVTPALDESEAHPSKLVTFLRSRYPELRWDGFLFFDLRRER